MTEFAELIIRKDVAVKYDEECTANEQAASVALNNAANQREASALALADAHKAIHDVLAEYGEHYLVDQKDGTLTVYKPSDELPEFDW